MSYYIDIQHACESPLPVTDDMLNYWAQLSLKPYCDTAELTLRFVDAEEITHLNHHYRKKNQPTNVLAFPATYSNEVELDYPLLGDVIICPSVLEEESKALNKPLTDHWAHIVIHGVLHLLGYDHIEEEDATVMQAIETQLLAQLGFDNPYESQREVNQIE
jgi:probable rRNA maturation factor